MSLVKGQNRVVNQDFGEYKKLEHRVKKTSIDIKQYH